MITVRAEGLKVVTEDLLKVERQIPFALALANTRMAKLIQAGEISVMRKRLDRPTATTLNSVFVKPGTKAKPEAKVWLKDTWGSGIPADKYMRPAVYGGVRGHKRFEKALIAKGFMPDNQYAIPSKDYLDANGNIRGQLAMRILSGLGAAETVSGVTANASNSRRSRKKGNADRYFVGEVDGINGVWERRRMALGVAVRPVFVFTGAPLYKMRIPFFKIANNMIKAHYDREFSKAMSEAKATARPR